MLRSSLSLRLLLGVFLLTAIGVVSPAPTDPGGIPHVPGEIIIKFKANVTEQEKDQIRAELGGSEIRGLGRIKAELRRLGTLSVEDAVTQYRNHPKIEYIEPNYIVEASEIPNDPRFNELWGMLNTGQTGGTAGADISATNAWDVFTGSDQVLIGVIDTGVDYTHPDLAANIYTNPGEIPNNGIDDDNNGFIDDVHGWDFYNDDNDPMDDHGHGSHVSGTIGAIGNNGIGVAGVCWNVKIVPLKFLSSGGSGSTADAVDAVNYATALGVNLTSNSWGGGGYSQALYDAISAANAAGQLFVAAAGNNGSNTDISANYPSCYDLPNIVSVAATDHNDALASFSNYGVNTVDLAAPGVDILSTFPGNTYGSISGTSMATPHVAGALGLVFGRFPAIGHLDAKNLLLNFVDPLPNLNGVVLTGGRLNAFFPIAEPDSIPPGPITDLVATEAGSNWLVVGWSATGDDGMTGTASRYVVKYSTSPIDATNFDMAMSAANPPDPGPPGTAESMKIAGLDFDTTYYVAVKALDEFGNASDISNVASGTTLGIPDIAGSPLSFTETLLTGGTSTQMLTLSNVGFGTLDWTAPAPQLIVNPPVVQAYVDLGKDDIDARPGVLGTGGPDGFGYRWTDSDDPTGPAFNWTDISGTGTLAMSTGDDANNGPYPIGFTFQFYGVDYDNFRVCSNGWLSFNSTSTAYGNQPLPNSGAPTALVAPFWDDLNLTTSGEVYYQSDGSRLIVQWNNVAHYSAGGPYTFQAILESDGTILYQYLSMGSPTNSCTIGIQNAAQTDGLQVVYNTAYLHDNMAIRLAAVPQWVTVSPSSGTIYAPNSTMLNVDFDAAGLLGGVYDANILVFSNDPDENPFTIPVQMTVIGAPDIELAPTAIDFGPVFIGATPTDVLHVQNPGTDVLTVSSVSVDDAVYSLAPTAFTVPPKSSVDVTITFAPTMVASHPATVTVQSDDPDEPTVTMSLMGSGVVPPDFAVSPTTLHEALFTGQMSTQQVTLTNAGGADLEYSIAVDLGSQVQVYDYPELAKGEEDLNAGILGTGGPDNFGYNWIDSDEVGGPTFDWVDISGVGTPIYGGNADDSNQGPFPIGFDFSFYGNTFSTFRVSSNGFISFTSTSSDLSNAPLPGTGAPENLLAVFHDDMYVDADIPSQVYYHNDGARLIVQFHNLRRYNQADTAPPFYDMEAILYPNGTILYQYLTTAASGNNSATIGIQNDARDDGLTVVYNADYVHDGLAIRFAAAPDWITASPLTGTISPGGSQVVDVNFNATDLFGGLYVGGLNITTNDPLAPAVNVPATLQVTGAPNLALDPTSIDFGSVFVGYPDLHEVFIANTGTDVLTITGLATNNPAFTWFLAGGTVPINIPPLSSTVLQVRFAPPTATSFSATMTINSNDPDAPHTLAVMGNGLIAPVAAASPTTLSSDLFTGETETQTVMLTNGGGSDLNFSIASQLTASSVPVYDRPDLAKGEVDPNPGILGTGGPDMFGYSWVDSDEPGGPVFDWVDISGVGTPIYSGNADDSNRGPFPIGFDFSFYGNSFSTFRVSSNGFISFTSTSSDLSNAPLPGTGAPENLLAVFHDDMYVDADIPSQVYYHNDGGRLIVQFHNVRRYNQSDSSPPFYDMEAILYPNGKIVYQYLTVADSGNNSATIGIQNATRDDGLMVVYNADYVHDGLAIRLSTVPDWLTANPNDGVVPPGSSLPIGVTFDASGLFGGGYDGNLLIESNDPAHGVIEISAHLDVTGVPLMGYEPESMDFGNVFIGYPVTLSMTMTNVGTDVLSISSMGFGLPDYSVDLPSFDLNPLESRELFITFDPQAAGDRSTQMTCTANDAGSPHLITLSGVGLVAPVISMTPDPVVGAAMPGGSKTKTLTICNTGGSDLTFDIAEAEHASAVQVYSELILPKQADEEGSQEPVDPRPSILGTGGPDLFGYTWTDSDEPGGPVYDWTDISGVGTPVPFPSYVIDGNVGPLPIGFDFPFYDGSFSEVYVCSNGWLSFTNNSLTSYSNQPLPNNGASTPENLLAPWWDDMVYDESDGNNAFYYNDGSRFIIQFYIRRIAEFTPPFYLFQVILYPNGNIVYQYHTLGTTLNSNTIGIQNGTKDDGLTVVYNDGSYAHEELAILFSARPDWLSVSPTSGVVPAGECMDLAVTMDAAELEAGDYFGTITCTSNDPATPMATSEVVFHVGTIDAASCDADPTTLNLGANGNSVTAYTELPMGYAPEDVVLETVRLNGVVPADRLDIDDYNDNGIPDLTFKFDRSAVAAILAEGDSVPVTITGEIRDTIYFVCTDYIRVIHPTMMHPNGGETLIAGGTVEISWANPQDWIVTSASLTWSPDGGQTWNIIVEGITGTSYTWQVPAELTTNALVRVHVYDAVGVLGSDSSDEVFSIGENVTDTGDRLPTEYTLSSISGNPVVSGNAVIQLALPQDGNVNVRIYDVRGALVRELVTNQPMPAGRHYVEWDRTNRSGVLVSSGIYFVRAQTAGKDLKMRVTVLR